MMITKKSLLTAGMAGLALMSFGAMAEVSPEEAAKLTTTLTPMGAERAGNAEGTIPAWNPDFKVPASYKGPGEYYPDPYADEKPLFTITAANMDQHADKLTPGLKAMFKTYPETFKMNIYPSHRNGSYSEFKEQQVIANATRGKLIADGNGVENVYGGPGFPIPKNGLEAVWNITTGPAPHAYTAQIGSAVIYRNGKQTIGRKSTISLSPFLDPNDSLENFKAENKPRIYQINLLLAPTRKKGEAFLVHDFVNQKLQPRAAWNYLPGTRRVRRAPTVGYDTPQGLGNLQTTDGFFGFNGAPDRYNWTLLGKKEIYIPYNSYKFEDPNVSYKELLPVGHANPDYMRYELHRVWVVQADLKDGERHVYKKRVLFIDEDSWGVALADQYDSHDVLWRTTAINRLYAFDLPGLSGRAAMYNDLISKEYFVDGLYNEEGGVPAYNVNPKKVSYFTTGNLRKVGVR